MSGKMLPDVQIVAATNPTIQPSVLKENIRQRFMFHKFDVDEAATREYIKEETGLYVGDLVKQIQTTGDDYNILSPRSLTKLAKWIMTAKTGKEAKKISTVINRIWSCDIGDKLLKAWQKKFDDPEEKAKLAIIDAMRQVGANELANGFVAEDDKTIEEIVSSLEELGFWKDVAEILKTQESPESEDNSSVSF